MTGFPSDDAKLNAIITADQNASFVFSYKNSDIYCRPTCQAHPPLLSLADISFYPSSDAAKSAGLTPCVVCNPDLPVHVDSTIVQQTVNAVNSSIQNNQQQQQHNPSQQHLSQHIPVQLQQDFPIIHQVPQQSSLHQSLNPVRQTPSPLPMTYDFNPRFLTQQTSPAISLDSPMPNHFQQHSQPQNQLQQHQQHQQQQQQHQQFFLRHNRSSSTATSPDFPPTDTNGWRPRRASIANGHIAAAAAAVEEISKNPAVMQQQQQHFYAPTFTTTTHSTPRREERHRGEGDHARLVNEACLHIAAAAAAAAQQAVKSSNEEDIKNNQYASPSRNASVDRKKQMFKLQRKKRRGGILGFKELAAKAGLSPWHFHRVFRSVTGLTPKAYGDACWNTVTSSMPPIRAMPIQTIVNNTNSGNINSNTVPNNNNMMQFYKAPSRSASSSAVNEMVNPYQHQYSVGTPNVLSSNTTAAFNSDESVPMFDVGVSAMNYSGFSSAGRVNTFSGPVGNEASLYKGFQQQPMPMTTQFYQTVEFPDPQLGFPIIPDNKGVASSGPDPLYSASGMDSLTSTNDLLPAVTSTTSTNTAAHNDTSNRHGYNHWMPLPLFLDDPCGTSVGADLLFDDSSKAPLCIPAVGVLMTENLELEPPMSMMHLDSAAPIGSAHSEV